MPNGETGAKPEREWAVRDAESIETLKWMMWRNMVSVPASRKQVHGGDPFGMLRLVDPSRDSR